MLLYLSIAAAVVVVVVVVVVFVVVVVVVDDVQIIAEEDIAVGIASVVHFVVDGFVLQYTVSDVYLL